MEHHRYIQTRQDGGIQTITLNRPEKRNALDEEVIRELTEALEAAAVCRCGVVILTGAGSAFCAGLDLEHLEAMTAKTPEEHRRDSERVAKVLRTLYDFPKPTIAAVNGAAIAGGMGIATVCDFTLSVPEAKFGYTEVRIGFIPAIVSSFLKRQVGEKRTRELLISGRIMKAPEAMELGLVTRIVPDQDLIREAEKLAHVLLRNSPESMIAIKRLLSQHAKETLDREIEEAIEWNSKLRATEDFKEGVRAFLEKRTPVWPSQCK
ncbi:MAG TPA: enoyl-CoA hydratase-related protein [Acidisarcina sp.]|nr:enoyl-CoA hydratase-related protein [Acidisarcina sp.]